MPAATVTAAIPPLGILLLDKPIGLSSNAALQRVRRLAGGVKAGHAGSLDPLASGMLAVCLGEATRLAGELLAGRKAYQFVVRLGERTATGDAEGAVIERSPVPRLTAAAVDAALVRFRGPQQQVPPMYAALKHAGEPLYRLARRGVAVPRAPRSLIIDELELLRFEPDRLELRVLCSKGTYVRVLGEDLAHALGSCGHLTALRRLYLEPFVQEPMIDLTTLETRPVTTWPLLPPERALLHRPALRLHAAALRALAHGRVLPLDAAVPPQASAQAAPSPAPAARYRLYDEQGRFCGLGALDEHGRLKASWLLRALRLA